MEQKKEKVLALEILWGSESEMEHPRSPSLGCSREMVPNLAMELGAGFQWALGALMG
jgi:hypothetical protein